MVAEALYIAFMFSVAGCSIWDGMLGLVCTSLVEA
jgi:hypothetical protein